MMNETAKVIYSLFKKKHPEEDVLSIIDYDDSAYVVGTTYDMFAISKKDNSISHFLPSLDLDKFDDAATNRAIYSKFE